VLSILAMCAGRYSEGADVDQVLNWARDNARGRRFDVYARVIGGQTGELGLVRLLGTDPSFRPSAAGMVDG